MVFPRPFFLELGAGDNPSPWFVHNDTRPLDDIEIVCPAEIITEFVETPAAAIKAAHLLEHFPWNETVNVLKEWYRALESGGRLELDVPNMAWQTRAHVDGEIDDERFVYYVYGEQDHEGNFHRAGFTERLLAKRLGEAGFVDIGTQDIGMVILGFARRPLVDAK